MKIAFIGVGGIARNYRDNLRKIEQPVASVCDINAETAAKVADEESATSYTDHREMLREEKPDAVFICIPPGAHTTQVIDAVEAGAAVFVAKPVARDLDTARRTREAILKHQTINQVGYMARYSDATEEALRQVDGFTVSMGLGRFFCRMSPSHPWWGKFDISGGQMLEQTTHVFNYLRYFMGDVTEVQAFGKTNVSGEIADFEEVTTCNLLFENGSIGSITSTCVARAQEGFSAELIGDDFYLKQTMPNRLTGDKAGSAIDFTGEEVGFYRQIELFLKAVETNDQSLVRSDYEDGIRTLAVTIAANKSLRSGQVEAVPRD